MLSWGALSLFACFVFTTIFCKRTLIFTTWASPDRLCLHGLTNLGMTCAHFMEGNSCLTIPIFVSEKIGIVIYAWNFLHTFQTLIQILYCTSNVLFPVPFPELSKETSDLLVQLYSPWVCFPLVFFFTEKYFLKTMQVNFVIFPAMFSLKIPFSERKKPRKDHIPSLYF